MSENRTTEFLARFNALKSERESTWDSHWKEIAQYLLPGRGRFVTSGDKPNRGEKRNDKIIDSQGTQSLRMIAAGMHGGLTPLSRPWFRLGTSDPDLQNAPGVRDWLAWWERKILHAKARSNFYECAATFFLELPGFGTGLLLALDDAPLGVRYHCATIGEYYLGTNYKGQVDTLYRLFWMTPRQMEQQFGRAKMSQAAQNLLEKSPFEPIKVIHGIEPNKGRDPGKADGRNKPYASYYLEEGGDDFLSVGGFEEQPFMAARWDVVGNDAYGRGPGMDVLGDVKMLQSMSEAAIYGIQLQVRPPHIIPSTIKGVLNDLPGGRTYYDGTPENIRPLFQVNPDLNGVRQYLLEVVKPNIRAGFFNDLFLTVQNHPDMTATEVAERHAEKLLLLGPVIERTQSEVLDPDIQRTFSILFRQIPPDQAPPIPKELVGQDIKVEYISLLAQAQKAVGTASISQFAAFVGSLAQLKPDVLDKANFDAAVDEYAEAQGVPPKLLVTDDQVAQVRQGRAQAQAAAMQAEEQRADALSMTQQAKDLGSIPSEGNVMADMAGAVAQ
ncbi:MAG: portal protein [Thermodesulfobacteriota bacterium]